LADTSAEGESDQMRLCYLECVEKARRVVGQVRESVPRLVCRGPSGVSQVVANHEPRTFSGEALAESFLPEEYRTSKSCKEKNRRIGGFAEGFKA
jgi:hypothetical protein